ncbi:high mobility group box domain-containing protein, partial [Dichomitus squalens]
IPRPPNAFIIFRMSKCADFTDAGVESDHRIISKIFGELWKKMGPEERAPYVEEAKRRAREHKMKHPNYRFSPK